MTTIAKSLHNSEPSDSEKLRDKILSMNIFNSVFVDCTASHEVASLYQAFLEHNISVVAANKIAASSKYENYLKLKLTALQRGVKFRFETNVGAGLPIIGTINDLRNSGDKILKIEAVLSGTLNFIFNALSPTVTLSQAVHMAKEEGYSEPDPRIDLSGRRDTQAGHSDSRGRLQGGARGCREASLHSRLLFSRVAGGVLAAPS